MPDSLQTVYLACAAAGGTVLLLQTVMLVIGGDGGEADLAPETSADVTGSGEHHGDDGLGLLSIRTVAAFMCFFGLGGWAGLAAGYSGGVALACGVGAGIVMLFAVAFLFRMQRRLSAQGNQEPARAVGSIARVYLRIPADNVGKGKIQVVLQGRTAEFQASTRAAHEIPTGAEVRIVRMITPDTFEVEPA